jgi:uncharacterized protein YceK
MKYLFLALVIGITARSVGAHAYVQESVLYNFNGGTDGNGASGGGVIADAAGNLYGVTPDGGDGAVGQLSGNGIVFRLSPPKTTQVGWAETVLYRFMPKNDGSNPVGGLLADGHGNLYGATSAGGNGVTSKFPGYGAIFELSPPAEGQSAWKESILHAFKGSIDGAAPQGSLIADFSGILYGVTGSGGPHGAGTVFELVPPIAGRTAWTETTLYSFTGGADGKSPNGGLTMDSLGRIYGTTLYGGKVGVCAASAVKKGCGVVFMLSPPKEGLTTWTATTLWSFAGAADGAVPVAPVAIDSAGSVYGATVAGGKTSTNCPAPKNFAPAGCGTVFKLTPPTTGGAVWTKSVIWTFGGFRTDGFQPNGVVLAPLGQIYGTSQLGGLSEACGANPPLGCGTVFVLSPPAKGKANWSERVLWNFQAGSADVEFPGGPVLLRANKKGAVNAAFGAAYGGVGPAGGAVFEITQ